MRPSRSRTASPAHVPHARPGKLRFAKCNCTLHEPDPSPHCGATTYTIGTAGAGKGSDGRADPSARLASVRLCETGRGPCERHRSVPACSGPSQRGSVLRTVWREDGLKTSAARHAKRSLVPVIQRGPLKGRLTVAIATPNETRRSARSRARCMQGHASAPHRSGFGASSGRMQDSHHRTSPADLGRNNAPLHAARDTPASTPAKGKPLDPAHASEGHCRCLKGSLNESVRKCLWHSTMHSALTGG